MKRRGDFSIFDIGAAPNIIEEWWHPSASNHASLWRSSPASAASRFQSVIKSQSPPSALRLLTNCIGVMPVCCLK